MRAGGLRKNCTHSWPARSFTSPAAAAASCLAENDDEFTDSLSISTHKQHVNTNTAALLTPRP